MVNNQSNHYFNFEDDFIKDLRCIPLCVRRKLDLIGIKLKLTHWQDFN
ncbi:nitrate reductase associated protein, partial [Prochlorococcus sp. AH-736-L23]|nr:nitrate reductase associated protein [Prochlorococcus sp. AH-736-L23]